jgi:transcriptional regulator with XRE-family HTH domain
LATGFSIPSSEGNWDLAGLGERIRNIRMLHKETQSELGEHLGVTRRSVANYERGTACIPVNVLLKISEHYDVSVLWLLGTVKQ